MNTDKKGCGKGFKSAELDRLLDYVEKHKPYGFNKWETLMYDYNRNLPSDFVSRDVEALRRKFKTMVNTKKPTGDPSIPEEVKHAKYLQRMIENNIGVQVIDDDYIEDQNRGEGNETFDFPILESYIESNDKSLDKISSIDVNNSLIHEIDGSITPRLGKTYEELNQLKRDSSSIFSYSHKSFSPTISETVRKKLKLDESITEIKEILKIEDKVEKSSAMDIITLMMEHEIQWRKENEERRREEKREKEEQDRKDRQEREERERRERIDRENREKKAEERFLLLLSTLQGKKD